MVNFILVIAVVLFGSVHSYASEMSLEDQQAVIAVNLFSSVCFFNYKKDGDRVSFLNKTFPRFTNGRGEIFKHMFKVTEGDAWAVNIPNKGNYVVVVSKQGACHVVAHAASADKIHALLSEFSETAKKKMPMLTINYKPKETGENLSSSGFEVQGQTGKNLLIIVGSTPLNPDDRKPSALLSMMVR